MNVNVARRLADLHVWAEAWQLEDGRLRQQVELLDPNRRADVLRGSQLSSLRRQLALKITQQPSLPGPGYGSPDWFCQPAPASGCTVCSSGYRRPASVADQSLFSFDADFAGADRETGYHSTISQHWATALFSGGWYLRRREKQFAELVCSELFTSGASQAQLCSCDQDRCAG